MVFPVNDKEQVTSVNWISNIKSICECNVMKKKLGC